jgi:hypothetical protein
VDGYVSIGFDAKYFPQFKEGVSFTCLDGVVGNVVLFSLLPEGLLILEGELGES